METLVTIVHVIAAITIVGLVLLQQGKGADAGASFGSGASQTVFGSSGSGNFLVKATTIAATVFFVTSLSLAIFARGQGFGGSSEDLPIVNEALLQEANNAQSDVPELDAQPDTANDSSDVPSLPDTDN